MTHKSFDWSIIIGLLGLLTAFNGGGSRIWDFGVSTNTPRGSNTLRYAAWDSHIPLKVAIETSNRLKDRNIRDFVIVLGDFTINNIKLVGIHIDPNYKNIIGEATNATLFNGSLRPTNKWNDEISRFFVHLDLEIFFSVDPPRPAMVENPSH